jgi:hypothetical protein
MNDKELTTQEQQLVLMKTECEIRNAINFLSAEMPSLEFGPLEKAFDLVYEACDLLDAEQERLLRLMARHQIVKAINEQDCEDDYSHLWHSKNG